jgi:hypothetical protein
MSPLNPLDIGAFKKFALQQLYAELYPMILGDFKHKDDIAKIIDAMTVIQHALVKPLPGSFEAIGPARKAALTAQAKTGKIGIQAVEEGGVPFLGGIQR